MNPIVLPAVQGLVSLFRNRGVPGVSRDVVSSVMDAFEQHVTQDRECQKLLVQQVQHARAHDMATFNRADQFSNTLRSCVRPLVTFAAMGWYIYARLHGVPLSAEDYAIIGGVLTFWFGLRPLEKNRQK